MPIVDKPDPEIVTAALQKILNRDYETYTGGRRFTRYAEASDQIAWHRNPLRNGPDGSSGDGKHPHPESLAHLAYHPGAQEICWNLPEAALEFGLTIMGILPGSYWESIEGMLDGTLFRTFNAPAFFGSLSGPEYIINTTWFHSHDGYSFVKPPVVDVQLVNG